MEIRSNLFMDSMEGLFNIENMTRSKGVQAMEIHNMPMYNYPNFLAMLSYTWACRLYLIAIVQSSEKTPKRHPCVCLPSFSVPYWTGGTKYFCEPWSMPVVAGTVRCVLQQGTQWRPWQDPFAWNDYGPKNVRWHLWWLVPLHSLSTSALITKWEFEPQMVLGQTMDMPHLSYLKTICPSMNMWFTFHATVVPPPSLSIIGSGVVETVGYYLFFLYDTSFVVLIGVMAVGFIFLTVAACAAAMVARTHLISRLIRSLHNGLV